MYFARSIRFAAILVVACVGCSSNPHIEGISIPDNAPSDLAFIFTSIKEQTPASAPSMYIPEYNAIEGKKWNDLSTEYWKTSLTIFNHQVQAHLRHYVEFYHVSNAVPALMEQLETDDDPNTRTITLETMLIINTKIEFTESDLQALYEKLASGEYEFIPEREHIPGKLSDYDNWRSSSISQALKARKATPGGAVTH
jgi:hypothetical protein